MIVGRRRRRCGRRLVGRFIAGGAAGAIGGTTFKVSGVATRAARAPRPARRARPSALCAARARHRSAAAGRARRSRLRRPRRAGLRRERELLGRLRELLRGERAALGFAAPCVRRLGAIVAGRGPATERERETLGRVRGSTGLRSGRPTARRCGNGRHRRRERRRGGGTGASPKRSARRRESISVAICVRDATAGWILRLVSLASSSMAVDPLGSYSATTTAPSGRKAIGTAPRRRAMSGPGSSGRTCVMRGDVRRSLGHRRRGRRRLAADRCQALVQALAQLVGLYVALRAPDARDDDACRRDARDPGEADELPRLRLAGAARAHGNRCRQRDPALAPTPALAALAVAPPGRCRARQSHRVA